MAPPPTCATCATVRGAREPGQNASTSKFSRHVATPGAPDAPSPAAREGGRVGERRGRPGFDARVDHVGRGQPSTFPRPRRARGSRRSSEPCARAPGFGPRRGTCDRGTIFAHKRKERVLSRERRFARPRGAAQSTPSMAHFAPWPARVEAESGESGGLPRGRTLAVPCRASRSPNSAGRPHPGRAAVAARADVGVTRVPPAVTCSASRGSPRLRAKERCASASSSRPCGQPDRT
jgi:hypothetical protein